MSYSDNKIDILNLNIDFAHSIMTVDIKTEKKMMKKTSTY
jgi:hypothetical protein